MKKGLKIFCIVFFVFLFSFIIFVVEESIRLSNNPGDKPLIILDKVMCSKDSFVCYNEGKYTEEYFSLGFVVRLEYYLDEGSSDDNVMYHLVSEEFVLFNKFIVWAWIS